MIVFLLAVNPCFSKTEDSWYSLSTESADGDKILLFQFLNLSRVNKVNKSIVWLRKLNLSELVFSLFMREMHF